MSVFLGYDVNYHLNYTVCIITFNTGFAGKWPASCKGLNM